MTTTSLEMRPFGKSDWYGYAGCVTGPDGLQPSISIDKFETLKKELCVLLKDSAPEDTDLSAEVGIDLITDGEGISINFYTESGYVALTRIDSDFWSAVAISRKLPPNPNMSQLLELGFPAFDWC